MPLADVKKRAKTAGGEANKERTPLQAAKDGLGSM
jgi:hypothetical protein